MIKIRIHGVPYCQQKARGNTDAPKQWSNTVRAQTRDLPKVKGPCRMHVLFLLPPDKFPTDHPYGPDLDNLVKRLCDAMNHTVFSQVPGKDGAIAELVAEKRRVEGSDLAGADIEITMV